MCKWFCELNPIEIVIGFLVGILTSYVYAVTTDKLRSNRLTKKYSTLAGRYVRYWKEDKVKGEGKVFVTADISSSFENKLLIEVRTLLEYGDGNPSAGIPYKEENIQVWTGEITMDSIRTGIMVWEQKRQNNGNSGFKRIIFNTSSAPLTIVGEKEFGFDVERFTEKINAH